MKTPDLVTEQEDLQQRRKQAFEEMRKTAKRRRRMALLRAAASLVLFFGLIGGVGFGLIHLVTEERRDGYEVWIRVTGNPHNLTFEEWRALYVNCKYRDDLH